MKRERLIKNELGEYEWVPVGIRENINRNADKTYVSKGVDQVSTAAGVHSRQTTEFNEMYRQHGITGAYHRSDGVLVISDNNSRNEVMKLRGLFDRDAGYKEYAGSAED